MKKITRIGSLMVSALLLNVVTGCAVESDTTPLDSELANSDFSEETEKPIASVDVGYGTVHFYETKNADGSTSIAIGQLAPIAYGATPLFDVMAQHTNLEVFLALVPDQEAPQSYVDAHANQAKELGRESDEILEVDFDPDAAVEKVSATCRNWITPASKSCYDYTYSNVTNLDNAHGTTAQNVTLPATNKSTTSGICNDGTGNVKGRLRWANISFPIFDSPGWTPNVPAGSGWIWFGAYKSGSCTPTGNNDICIPPNLTGYWRVEGKSNTTSSSNTYDLRAAIIQSVSYTCIIR